LYLAAFLLSQGIRLAGCDRSNPHRLRFFFPASARLHGLLRIYWSRQPIPLVPADFFRSFQRFKTLVLLHGKRERESASSEPPSTKATS
jgi:hypothetical protein